MSRDAVHAGCSELRLVLFKCKTSARKRIPPFKNRLRYLRSPWIAGSGAGRQMHSGASPPGRKIEEGETQNFPLTSNRTRPICSTVSSNEHFVIDIRLSRAIYKVPSPVENNHKLQPPLLRTATKVHGRKGFRRSGPEAMYGERIPHGITRKILCPSVLTQNRPV
jgi:hypothetical protein